MKLHSYFDRLWCLYIKRLNVPRKYERVKTYIYNKTIKTLTPPRAFSKYVISFTHLFRRCINNSMWHIYLLIQWGRKLSKRNNEGCGNLGRRIYCKMCIEFDLKSKAFNFFTQNLFNLTTTHFSFLVKVFVFHHS